MLFDLNKLCHLNDFGTIGKALSYVFEEFDRMMKDGAFDECDAILKQVEPDRLDPSVAIGFLTITLPAKNLLNERTAIVSRVEASLLARMDHERASSLLRGLR